MDASTSISAYLSKTTLEDEETSGFRILDAPREVRDKIYEHVLKVYVPAAELHRPAPAFERPNTAILYINRQINEEASRIFATSNKFVCVKTNVKCLISGCRPKAIAWMNPKDIGVTAMWYPHYMMTFEIFENTGTNGRTLVIPHSQLELLCTVLNHLGQVARETTQSPPHEVPEPEDSSPYQHSMTVTMHKPLGSEYAANNYAFLTDPLPRHFRDHHNSSQVSHQPDGLDQKVSQAISSPRFKTVEEAFTALQQLKEAGASAWKDKDYQQAANLWTNALYEARFWFREPSLGSWIKTKAAENADRFNEWQYRAGLNAAAAWLALAKTKPAERQYYASMSEWVLHRIPQLQPPIGWEPDTAMLAKFDYRSAVAERMLGNLPPAREAIHSAIAEAPNDPAVRAEFELIESESRIASGTAGTDIIEIPMGSFRWPG